MKFSAWQHLEIIKVCILQQGNRSSAQKLAIKSRDVLNHVFAVFERLACTGIPALKYAYSVMPFPKLHVKKNRQ